MTTTTQKRAAAVRRQEWDSARRASLGTSVGDAPVPGYYALRVKRGPKRGAYEWVPVRIFYDTGTDPVTGEPMDRTAYLRVQLERWDVEPDAVWPWCANWPIPDHDWRCMIFDYPERTSEGWVIQWQ